jgi:hypothetical protein
MPMRLAVQVSFAGPVAFSRLPEALSMVKGILQQKTGPITLNSKLNWKQFCFHEE